MKITPHAVALVAAMSSVLLIWSASCGGTGGLTGAAGTGASSGSGGANGAGGLLSTGVFASGALSSGTGGQTQPCVGLQCQVHACTGGGTTTVSGTIYDPAGKNPLYGIVAYVPNTPPLPFTAGAACTSCADLYTGDPVAAAVTDAAGKFTIKNAPDGANIPLVIQVGKWRRQLVIPAVTQCGDTSMPDKMLTLPKNGSEGDLPDIAISTGNADTLECLLPRIGVDKAEYVAGAATGGHIHIFRGDSKAPNTNPKAPDPSQQLWDSAADIMKYDILLLSCEGHETDNMNQQVLFDYAAAGGRVFASHFHYAWFNTGPFGNENLATWTTGGQQIGSSLNATIVTTLPNSTPFVRGQALLAWLGNVNALTGGELPIQAPRHNADVSAANTASQPWIVADPSAQVPGATQDFTFDTPLNVAPEKQCGRVVFSDMHVGAASGDYANSKTTPGGCADNDLSPQEKALEFIFFDLSSCVTPNNIPMQPPGTGSGPN